MKKTAREIGFLGVFTAEGDHWKRQRKLTAPAFTPIKVRGHYEAITMITSRLHNKWQKKLNEKKNPDKGVVINILPELMSFTLDIISLIAFGYDLNSIEKT